MKKLLASTALMLALAPFAVAQEYVPDPDAKSGGDIVITYKDDVATLDPAIGYDWQNWSMIKSLFDGLMDYMPGTTELRPGLAESYTISDDGMTFTFKPASGRHVPQRPRDDRRGREILPRPRHEPRDPVARRGLLRLDPRLSTRSRRRGRQPRRRQGDRPADRRDHAQPSRRHLPARHGAQLRLHRAAGGRRGRRRRFRQAAGRDRRLQARRLDHRPEPDLREERGLLARGHPLSRQRALRGGPGADRGAAAAPERRGRRARRRHPAGEVRRGDGRSGTGGAGGRGRPAPHRLHHAQHADPALRQRRRAQGRQHGDQQGADHPDHQRPRGAGDPAAAAVDAGLHRRLRGLSVRSRRRQGAAGRGGLRRTGSRPSSS